MYAGILHPLSGRPHCRVEFQQRIKCGAVQIKAFLEADDDAFVVGVGSSAAGDGAEDGIRIGEEQGLCRPPDGDPGNRECVGVAGDVDKIMASCRAVQDAPRRAMQGA